jgi:hypothetical protein
MDPLQTTSNDNSNDLDNTLVLASDNLPLYDPDGETNELSDTTDTETDDNAAEPVSETIDTETDNIDGDKVDALKDNTDEKELPNPDSDKIESEDDDVSGDDEFDTPTSENKIPVKRLNKEIEKRKKAEQDFESLQSKLQELENKLNQNNEPKQEAAKEQEPEQPKIDLNAEMAEAFNDMLDGDVEKASAKMAELIQNVQKQAAEEARRTATEEFTTNSFRTAAEQALKNEADRIVNTYPELNQNSDNFDQGIMDDMVRQRDIYISAGFSPSDALKEAESIMQLKYSLGKTQEPEPSPKPAPKPSHKNIQAAAVTPPKTTGSTDAETKPKSVMEMSEAEFDALTEAELAQLRGDYTF